MLKVLIIAALAMGYDSLTSVVNAGGGKPPSSPNGRFVSENTDIRQDLSAITMERNKIKFLEAKLKKDREAGNKAAMLADKKELAKARANLKHHKAYLSADKRDLVKSHKLVLSEKRKEIRRDRAALTASKRKLNKELDRGNEMAASECAAAVARKKNILENDKAALARARVDMNENMLAVNREIKESNGQFVGVIVAENAVAHVDNWITDKTK
ncbi:MAG TPA: hypothetical protein VI757_03210 [Bacteroidia bacterium]|nr:hypothetical protein [Bacteroidia bacterium]